MRSLRLHAVRRQRQVQEGLHLDEGQEPGQRRRDDEVAGDDAPLRHRFEGVAGAAAVFCPEHGRHVEADRARTRGTGGAPWRIRLTSASEGRRLGPHASCQPPKCRTFWSATGTAARTKAKGWGARMRTPGQASPSAPGGRYARRTRRETAPLPDIADT